MCGEVYNFLNKMEPLCFHRSPLGFRTRTSSEHVRSPENESKARSDSKRIIRFRFEFAIFYFLVYVISCGTIFLCLESAGCLEDPFLRSCVGEGLGKNIYGVGFSFDFHAFLSEKNESNIDNETQSIWTMRNLTYYHEDQPTSIRLLSNFSTTVSISEVSHHLRGGEGGRK